MKRYLVPLVLAPFCSPSPALSAQELSVLDPKATRWITQEITGDAAYEHIRFMTQFHRSGAGSDALWRVAEYYAERAKAFGLTDVQLIKQTSDERPWNAKFAVMSAFSSRLFLSSAVHLFAK